MSRTWIHEEPPRWDADKERIIGGEPPGTFNLGGVRTQEVVPGEWWRVEVDGVTAGYGWMDIVWGDGEMLLAVDRAHRGEGIGDFILEHLQVEAQQRGLRWLHNIVRRKHPQREFITEWLLGHGFERTGDEEVLRRRVPPAS